MIQNRDGDGFVADHAAEIAPAAARAPSSVALFSFAGEIGAVYAGVVEFGYRCGAAAGVGVDLGLVGRNFERADDAKAEHAVFFVGERNFFIEGAEGRDAVDAAKIGAASEDE